MRLGHSGWWLSVVAAGTVLVGAEWLARRAVDRVPRWYAAAEVVAGREPVDFVFVGSSRTGAALFSPAFEREVRKRTGRRVRVLNLGLGYSTTIEHYLGVRNLLAEHPEHLRGVRVLMEAPDGVPAPGFWPGAWAHAEQPWLLQEVLRWRDLRGYWQTSGDPLQAKLATSIRLPLAGLALVRRRERLRERLLERGTAWAAGRLQGVATGAVFADEPFGFDLLGQAAGGTRPGAEWTAAARRLALEHAPAWRNRGVWLRWTVTVQADLVRLVHGHGGRVLFFTVPLSSTFVGDSPERARERAAFAAWAAEVGSGLLNPAFDYDDDALPDLWHLDGAHAPEFSRALARAWWEADATEWARAGGRRAARAEDRAQVPFHGRLVTRAGEAR